MLKFGHISEVDVPKGLARVKFEGDDGIVSYWLPMSQAKTKEDKFIIPYDINEHVWCIMDDNMQFGIIGGAIYDETNAATGGADKKIRLQFVGGLFVEFDRQSNTLAIGGTGKINIDIQGDASIKCNKAVIESLTSAEVKATTQIKLSAPAIVCSGALTAPSISTTGGGNITSTGSMSVSGSISVVGEVTANGIPLSTHKHVGVTTGAGTSGTPIP